MTFKSFAAKFLGTSHAGRLSPKSLLALLLQALVVLMLVLGFFRYSISWNHLFAAQAVLSAVYFYLLFAEFRPEVRGEFKAYLLFFGGVWAFVQAAWLLQAPDSMAGLNRSVGVLVGLVAFFAAFRVLFGKRAVDARVLVCDGKTAAVHVDFDLLAGVSAGNYVVACPVKCKPGTRVKAGVKRFWFYTRPEKTLPQ